MSLKEQKSKIVVWADREWVLEPLSLREELAINDYHKSIAKAGEIYNSLKDLLQIASGADRAAILAEITRLEADKSTAAYRASMTPDGAAFEFWMRVKKAHPDVTRDKIRALVTETNSVELHELMYSAIVSEDTKSASGEAS